MTAPRRGITSYGSYLPHHRLDRTQVRALLGQGVGKGTRTVAGYDEDTTSMGVEAARRGRWGRPVADTLYFATTNPAYVDKTNATAIHAALAPDHHGLAVDMGASVRGASAALRAASATGGTAVLSDIRTGRPGSADEVTGGDGAVAFTFGTGEHVVAEILAEASVSAEFLDRWRVPGELYSKQWEERFGAQVYLPLIHEAAARALERADVPVPGTVIVSSPQPRAARGAMASITAQHRGSPTVRKQIAASSAVSYPDFLTWRGFLDREPPRRPDPARPAGPPSARSERWKYAFEGSGCSGCGTVSIPPQRVCATCAAVDRGDPVALADRRATVTTFTIDRLAFSPAPPVIDVVLDFDGGGRYGCQLTDADPSSVAIGDRVEMTFRRMYTADGVHNYFWKARPIGEAARDGQ